MSQSEPIYLSDTDDDVMSIYSDNEGGDIESKHNQDDYGRQRDEEKKMAGDEAGQRGADGTEEDEMDTGGVQIIKRTHNTGRDAYGGKRFRWWFLTWNNPEHPEDKIKLLQSKKLQYVKFQYEKGKEGTKHYQGVFYLKEAKTCRALLKIFPGCGYLAPVKDTKGAINYCGKSESRIDGPWEAGTMPAQGRRSDLLECKSIVDGGGGMDELYEHQFSNAVRYGRGLREYVNLVRRDIVRKWQTVCYAYIGDAGMGKTQAAAAEAKAWGGRTFWLTLEGGTFGKVWWDGYDGEENVIIDEFNCQLKLADFKRLIDSSPLKVPVKGGMVNMLAKRIWICSNKQFDVWYYKAAPPGPERNALMRRLHYREEFFTKFQGAPGYDEYIETREWFVELQKTGQYVVDTNA